MESTPSALSADELKSSSNSSLPDFTRYQKIVIAILAFLQFTVILDFMILSPLGAVIMPALSVTPAQFGMVVSAYALSAGVSGLLSAGFADRYDRKKMLLFFYIGFVIATFLCAIAPTYPFLLGARMLTGLFGGVMGAIVFAITTDLFPFEKRGRVMGFIQTAFAASQVLGIPIGLYFSNRWGWHAPFLMIVLVSIIVGFFIFFYLKPIDGHLKLQADHNPFKHLFATVTVPKYILAFSATTLLTMGGYMLMPFGSAFTVNNLGIPMADLPLIYLVTGVCAILIGPLVGRAADKFGKMKVFIFGTIQSIIMVLIYTHMGVSPLHTVMLVNVFMFIGIFSRMIPSQALMSGVPEPASRGAFMAVSASLQNIAGGIGSMAAGYIVVEAADKKLEHFDTLGYVVVTTALFTLIMMYFINRVVVRGVTAKK